MTAAPRRQPFDRAGISRGPDGVARYDGLPGDLVSQLRAVVDRDPDAPAVTEVGGPRLTYRRLWDAASRVAGGLREQGVRPGDRVALRRPNGVDWVLAFVGTQLAGGVLVPVNTRFTAEEAAYVVRDSGAGVVVDGPLPDGPPYAYEGSGPDDLAALFYTSGTTGAPKGAMLTHAGLVSTTESTRRIRALPAEGRGTRNLVSVPLFHVTGCASQLLSMLALGAEVVVLPRFEVTAFLSALAEHRITMSTSVPAIYALAVRQPDFASYDLSALETLSYGGAPIAPELVRRLRAAFPGVRLGNGYGLSEASSVVTFLPDEYAEQRAESVGLAIPVDDLRLLDPDPLSGVGELLVRGPNVAAGYWGRPEATAETFVDGWLHTGDLATLDDDGFVTVVDRSKDMINRGGENVYSLEVENVLATAPGVLEVAVVPVPDDVMGEKVGAVVVAAESFETAGLLALAREHLADFKVPEWVAVRSEPLPRNAGGKVLKAALRDGLDWRPVRRKR